MVASKDNNNNTMAEQEIVQSADLETYLRTNRRSQSYANDHVGLDTRGYIGSKFMAGIEPECLDNHDGSRCEKL